MVLDDMMEGLREIAERGEMKLHLADYHLESARLCLAQAEYRTRDSELRKNAKLHYEKALRYHSGRARRLVEECGYHRRDGELKELERGM